MRRALYGITLALLLQSMVTSTSSFQLTNAAYALPASVENGAIDVWMQYSAPYGGQGINQPADLVLPQQWLTLTAGVTYNLLPASHKNVTFEIRDSQWTIWSVLEGITNDSGEASVVYRMPWVGINAESLLGIWHVRASTILADVVATDQMDFHYDYLVRIDAIATNKLEYEHLETAKITVAYSTYSERNYDVWMTALLQDNLEVPVGMITIGKTIGSATLSVCKNYTSKVSILIASWAYAGLALVRINFLDRPPSENGASVITPEATTTIWISPSTRTNPTADFSWEPIEPRIRRTVTFNATSSLPGWKLPDLTPTAIVKYIWNLGDNVTNIITNNPCIAHAYENPGNFTIKLTVVDTESQQDSITQIVQVMAIVDIAVTNVTLSKTVVGQNCSIFFKVILNNEGDWTETLNLDVYADKSTRIIGDEVIVGTQIVTLQSGNSKAITYAWNATQMPRGNYTISAYAKPLARETDIADNVLTGSWVIISNIGDITGPHGWPDGEVDIRDIGTAAKAFGSYPGYPNWNANADITGPTTGVPDNKVDTRDTGLVAKYFGETST